MVCKPIATACKHINLTWGSKCDAQKTTPPKKNGLVDTRGIFSNSPTSVDLKNMVCKLINAYP